MAPAKARSPSEVAKERAFRPGGLLRLDETARMTISGLCGSTPVGSFVWIGCHGPPEVRWHT
jgi:hypothetical protein